MLPPEWPAAGRRGAALTMTCLATACLATACLAAAGAGGSAPVAAAGDGVRAPAAPTSLPVADVHYEIHLDVNPAARHVTATGAVCLVVPPAGLDRVEFYLHRQLAVTRLEIGGEARAGDPLPVAGSCRRDTTVGEIRYMPEATRVVFTPARPLAPGQVVSVDFACVGTITVWPEWNASVLGADWTEMGLYFPWFPFHPDRTPFTYDLTVQAPDDVTVFAVGQGGRDGAGWRFRTVAPTTDIVVVAAPDLKVRVPACGGMAGEGEPGEDVAVSVVHHALQAATVDTMLTDLARLHRLCSGWLGSRPGGLVLVESRRERGGGYARPGALFLAGLVDADYLRNREGYVRYLGHELAHTWWRNAGATTWEDWLNESFAEHTALLLVRELYGQEAYRRRLDRKREAAASVAPVWGYERSGEDAETVFYGKGPVLLADLEARLGSAEYLTFLRRVADARVSTTVALLQLLEESAGSATRHWFEQRLREG
ncbi:MAG: M1 family aminopeptidase [Candidatus Krumholzibacteriia bacterium]